MERNREQIDSHGHLHVPCENAMAKPPVREGWEPFFVSVVLTDPTPKVVIYKRVEST